MKHVFIVNKISGKGTNMKLLGPLTDIVQNMHLDYEIRLTQYPKHAKHIASEYNGLKDVILYSMGGDGTLYEVLNGMDKNLTLGVIPTGSGNDFYRIFDNQHLDIKDIIINTIKTEERLVDYASYNDNFFINTLSIGVDAKINEDASKYIRKTFIAKGPAYIMSILKNVIIPKSEPLKIAIDGVNYSDDYYICCIMNGEYYGNGKHSAPQAIIDDGYLDVTIVPKCSYHKIYPKLINYLNGNHLNDDFFIIKKTKHIEIKSQEKFIYQADGENYRGNSLDIKIIEKGLKLKI